MPRDGCTTGDGEKLGSLNRRQNAAIIKHTLAMNYTFEELNIMAEALSLLLNQNRHDASKAMLIDALADKVVKDQSSKGEA